MKTINIRNQGRRVSVTISNTNKVTSTNYFTSLDAAKDFVLPRGNRRTPCYLNGIKCMLAGWVMESALGI